MFSESRGLLEQCIDIGNTVRASDVLVRIYDTERTGVAPVEYRAKIDGVLAGRHFPGLVGIGDFLGVVAVPV